MKNRIGTFNHWDDIKSVNWWDFLIPVDISDNITEVQYFLLIAKSKFWIWDNDTKADINSIEFQVWVKLCLENNLLPLIHQVMKADK